MDVDARGTAKFCGNDLFMKTNALSAFAYASKTHTGGQN